MEYLENLGFNPWAFINVTLVSEVVRGRMVVATFEVTGDADTMDRLRRVREQIPDSRRHLVSPWST
jgi:hypothetical protein